MRGVNLTFPLWQHNVNASVLRAVTSEWKCKAPQNQHRKDKSPHLYESKFRGIKFNATLYESIKLSKSFDLGIAFLNDLILSRVRLRSTRPVTVLQRGIIIGNINECIYQDSIPISNQ